jgi:hypothetical protein
VREGQIARIFRALQEDAEREAERARRAQLEE